MLELTVDEILSVECPILLTSPGLEVYRQLSISMTDANYFGQYNNLAIALRMAHEFTIVRTRPDGVAGVITGLQEGRNAKKFFHKIPDGSISALHMTHYGQRLKSLIRMLGGAIMSGNPGVQ